MFNPSARLWFLTSLFTSLIIYLVCLYKEPSAFPYVFFLGVIVPAIGSMPAWAVLALGLPWINKQKKSVKDKFTLLYMVELGISSIYGLAAVLIYFFVGNRQIVSFLPITFVVVTGALWLCSFLATYFSRNQVFKYFNNHSSQINTIMDNNYSVSPEDNFQPQPPSSNNKILFKGCITGLLILLMLIPMYYVQNLVKEREERQKEVVKEVSDKWASGQTISGPYIVIPYTDPKKNKTVIIKDGSKVEEQKITSSDDDYIIILPENLDVDGIITPEVRKRTIYKVSLYKSNIQIKGNFQLKLPADISIDNLRLEDAKVCVGLSDFKGIEQALSIVWNGNLISLKPGLPDRRISLKGLSASIPLTKNTFYQKDTFSLSMKIKGSELLHFLPMSENSHYSLKSTISDPSFDGNVLPDTRKVTQDGFEAQWSFNNANLPFSSTISDKSFTTEGLSFGISVVQPANNYAKTMRSVKYALLLIGLSFVLFFVIELMQKKPLHPIQYLLVGFALVVFYTLLLSLSEFILFDYAYFASAFATILLIFFYTQSHFKSWKVAGIFATILAFLYGFIFILIRLEDTALLVGSIGLFMVIAAIMFASRKINWYKPA